MKVTMANIGAISNGELSFEKNRFNIKYAANGTGKSSFAKFLKATIDSDEVAKSRFVPLGTNNVPSLTFDCQMPLSCMLFDEDYINSYLFQPEDLLNNTIRLIKLNSDVSQALNAFDSALNSLKNAANSPKIAEFVLLTATVSASIKINNDGSINNGCKLAKATRNGANVLRSNAETEAFESIIESPNSPNWYKWHKDGGQFAVSCCPYCGQKLPNNFDETRNALKAIFDRTDAKNNIEVRRLLSGIAALLTGHMGISDLLSTTSSPSSIEYANATSELNQAFAIKNKIEKAKNLDPFDLRRMDEALFIQKIQDLMIDESSVDSQEFLSAIKAYNDQLTSLIKAAESFKDAVQRCDTAITSAISRFKNFINDYLSKCGIPYSFTVEQSDTKRAKAKLIKKKQDDTIVDVPRDALSYGEKNCLCLALFAIDVCQSNPEFIILDDPISSFDHGKRFAMFYLLFSNKHFSFKNRTVVLLTHDITPLIDFIKRKSGGVDDAKGWRLANKNGVLSEREILAEDIDSSLMVEKALASDCAKPLVVRLIHARRYFEIEGNLSAAYNFISSLFHGLPNPSWKVGESLYRPFTQLEIDEASQDIAVFSIVCDYREMIRGLNEPSLLLDYKNSADDYEKMAIARVLLDRCNHIHRLDKPFRYALNAIFHIEQESLFNCKLFAEECIPSYIVDFVDAKLKEQFPTLK